MSETTTKGDETLQFDTIIIGAGISGINIAYRLQNSLPHHTYAILESRDAIGGTWDLFRYPGIRSDSDLYTFGFPWRPWTEQTSIAEGWAIQKYVKESAELEGIDKHIKFGRSVKSADWRSDEERWVLDVEEGGKSVEYRSRFLMFCTGYYVSTFVQVCSMERWTCNLTTTLGLQRTSENQHPGHRKLQRQSRTPPILA